MFSTLYFAGQNKKQTENLAWPSMGTHRYLVSGRAKVMFVRLKSVGLAGTVENCFKEHIIRRKMKSSGSNEE